MKTSSVGLYAVRLSFGQMSNVSSQTTAHSYTTASPDRVVTRSATMLAVFGIALSSFSLKQMLAKNTPTKSQSMALRKF